jgi:photosystem I protein
MSQSQTFAKTKKPSYVFRASWALVLLGINFLVAAWYHGILK